MKSRKGFLGPQAVIQILDATEKLCGADVRDRLVRVAKLGRIPAWNEPVREEKVARLHQSLRRLYPDAAGEVARTAGHATTDYLLDHQISKRAQALLAAAPKPVAAWLVSQAAKQNAGSFGGSGEFVVVSSNVFELRNNPVLPGETATKPVCHYHAAAFERMFQRLVDPRMTCTETACTAAGADACRFEMAIPA